MEFDFTIKSELDPEYVCEQFGIDLKDFLALIEGKKQLESDKSILFVIEQFKKKILNDVTLSENTKKNYSVFLNCLSRFIKNGFENHSITSLTSDLFFDFLATFRPRKGTALTNGTKNTYIAIIRSLFSFAYTEKYISEDLRDRMKYIGDDLIPRHLPGECITALLNEAKKTSWPFLNYSIIYFMLMTGCRISEVVRLRVGDFNINEGVIFIRKSKNGRERYVPMYPELKEAILDYFSRTGLNKWSIQNEEALFTKRCIDKRTPLSIRNVQYMLDKLYEKIGIKGRFTVHGLRHTFAVNSIKRGMPSDILQQVLGHRSIESTRIYIQLLPKDLKEEVTKKYPFPYEKLLNDVFGIGRLGTDELS